MMSCGNCIVEWLKMLLFWTRIFSIFTQNLLRNNCTDQGLDVIKLEYSLKLKIKHNDWLLADTCPQAANHCALF